MKRILAIAFTWSALRSAWPMPSPRDPYMNRRRPPRPSKSICAAAHWLGKAYEGHDWHVIFEVNGSVTNTELGNTYKVGSWKATGNSVYFELHNKYYEFRGTLTGTVLHGDSSNTSGMRWKTTLHRIAPK